MKKRGFYKNFLSIYILLVLQNVLTLSVNLTDNIMLGAYSEISLSGVTAVNQIQFIFSADVPACTVTDDALSGSEFVTVSVADSHSVSVSVSELEPVLEVI